MPLRIASMRVIGSPDTQHPAHGAYHPSASQASVSAMPQRPTTHTRPTTHARTRPRDVSTRPPGEYPGHADCQGAALAPGPARTSMPTAPGPRP